MRSAKSSLAIKPCVCSLAYSRTGSVTQSQDLAQETFITAWRELRKLRDPEKLKSWLCTIARNITHDSIKEELREPSHRAESLEDIQESREATELPPPELAINNEEQAILWRAIERVPELYREPLILFYREHRSIEAVAESLELSEDAVKQRLSRGRKLLHEQVLAFVEGALERTNPGKTFTLAVIASLPALGLSANAAAITVATAKSGSALKTAGAAGLLGVLATPLVVLLGNVLPYRMAMAEARSDEERHSIRSVFLKILVISVTATVLSVGLFWSLYAGKYVGSPSLGQIAGSGFIGLVVFYLLTLFGALIVTLPRRRAYYRRVLAENYACDFPRAAFEFRTAGPSSGCRLSTSALAIASAFCARQSKPGSPSVIVPSAGCLLSVVSPWHRSALAGSCLAWCPLVGWWPGYFRSGRWHWEFSVSGG